MITPAVSTAARIFRYEVPVDDAWHEIELTGPPEFVAARDPSIVEFWAIHQPDHMPRPPRRFRVVGTGHPLPARYIWWGSALAGPDGGLVWHLIEDVS